MNHFLDLNFQGDYSEKVEFLDEVMEELDRKRSVIPEHINEQESTDSDEFEELDMESFLSNCKNELDIEYLHARDMAKLEKTFESWTYEEILNGINNDLDIVGTSMLMRHTRDKRLRNAIDCIQKIYINLDLLHKGIVEDRTELDNLNNWLAQNAPDVYERYYPPRNTPEDTSESEGQAPFDFDLMEDDYYQNEDDE